MRPSAPTPVCTTGGDEKDYNPVTLPAHYNAHPSGVECIDINGFLTGNIASAWKYVWRQDLKLNSLEDLKKAAYYLKVEVDRRKGIAIRKPTFHIEPPSPSEEKRVKLVFKTETGTRQQYFTHLWEAHKNPLAQSPVRLAIKCLEKLQKDIEDS